MRGVRVASYGVIALSGVWLCWITWAEMDLARWYARQGVHISDPMILFAIGGAALGAAAMLEYRQHRAPAVALTVFMFLLTAMSWIGMTR